MSEPQFEEMSLAWQTFTRLNEGDLKVLLVAGGMQATDMPKFNHLELIRENMRRRFGHAETQAFFARCGELGLLV